MARPEAAMARGEIKDRLRGFVCAELMCDPGYPLADDEPLISGGLIDSFAVAQLGVFIEEAFAVFIPDVDMTVEGFDTLDDIAARIEEWRGEQE